ncbi:hypothetical protein [Roseofilum casamattae]|uniref:Uncharacterized protein n=1 Tax=Roseofilum casamattae BLCC-M143 TaxID=3022442 RepID=A0ABT7BTF0_9CYAN|nr:hypothetical protein [Roseofilum casamattae]MDJ1182463.1 hypothetical protein [Roseofilum casamattae BLCC-M143]
MERFWNCYFILLQPSGDRTMPDSNSFPSIARYIAIAFHNFIPRPIVAIQGFRDRKGTQYRDY